LYVAESGTKDGLIIGKKEISYVDDVDDAELTTSGINFDQNSLVFYTNKTNSILDLSETDINVKGTLRISKTVYYGEKIKY
jgi:hypothetical protein